LVKKIIIVKNATAYTWDWYCHLVVDKASLMSSIPLGTFQCWIKWFRPSGIVPFHENGVIVKGVAFGYFGSC
jgi:hypothetical protein